MPEERRVTMKKFSLLSIFVCLSLYVTMAWAEEQAQLTTKGDVMAVSEKDVLGVIGQMHAKFGAKEKKRFTTGVRQVARLWRKGDGSPADFAKFCTTHFVSGKERDLLFERFQSKLELLAGYMNALYLNLRLEMDEDRGPLLPIDSMFAKYSPDAHVVEDLFQAKLAFVVLLNFPIYDLNDLLVNHMKRSRRDWAETRLGQSFAHRVPADVNQKIAQAYAAADNYIYNYNIIMDHVIGPDQKPMFRKDLKLISHWGLRDELKALYADPKKNLAQQEMIQSIMLRIILQEIPEAVINNPKVNWDPISNKVDGKQAKREPDTRFATLLDIFRAHQMEDDYYPTMPSHIDRRFMKYREIPEAEFVGLLESVMNAPASKKIAKLIEKRLGRKLQPFDIWYDGFKSRGQFDERKLDEIVKKKYPNIEAFQKDMPNILISLGFSKKTAEFLSDRIETDPARGAGHAWGPQMRTDKAHLRTRVPKGGMNYKGFNIAMHELGHCVEQVFSIYKVDHTLLEGVPNTAFTEGFAFVFQSRDLDVLGLSKPDEKAEISKVLDTFWATREIAGVGLVDIAVWHWMYKNPKAKPKELREAVIKIAKDVWNKHYAPIFGVKDSPILAIYSHMINSGLYLPDYPLGHIIAFQVEHYFKSHPLAAEMERMCRLGRILPNSWMKKAVGKEISAQPLIKAATKAVGSFKN
jgi:hypothetical protein